MTMVAGRADGAGAVVSPRPIAIVVALVMFIGILEGTVIATALPSMARDFGVPAVDLGVGITAYLLVSAMFLPISSWVAERVGTRTVLGSAIAGFAVASILCAHSRSLEAFVAARVLQALCSSLMVPVGNLVLLRVTPKRDLVQMMAISTTPALIAPVIGPPLGGLITGTLGWPAIFYLNLPMGAIGIFLVWRLVPNLRAPERPAFDLPGFVLVSMALAAFVMAMDRLGAHPSAWRGPALLAGAAILIGLLAVRHLRRAATPLVPLDAMRHQTFRSISFGGGFLMRLPFMGQALLLPLFFQLGLGFSPVVAGTLLLAQNLGDLMLKPVASRALRRMGFRTALVSGSATMMASVGALALIDPEWPLPVIFAAMLATGMARSIAFTAMMALTFADVTEAELSGAAVLNNLANALSAAAGISIAALVLNAAAGSGTATPGDYRLAVALLAGIGALSIPLLAMLRRDAGAAVSGHRITRSEA